MPRILVVDDAVFMRHSLKLILEKAGYEIVGEAEDGSVAVNKYKELRPDIVTMDITMPQLDGVSALKMIRSFDAKAKVIMISAMGQEGLVKEAVISGAIAFIVKPFKEDVVIETLKKIENK